MKHQPNLFFVTAFSFLLTALNSVGQRFASDPDIFVATTPCSARTRPLPGMSKDTGCEFIKWKLQLFGAREKHATGAYILDCDYGIPQQGTKGLIHGGNHLHREGKWELDNITRGNLTAAIYRLDPDKPPVSVSFLRLNENLIHLMDSKQHLMIGNGACGYTLNKISR